MSTLTLSDALKNAQTVLNDRATFCLNSRFEVDRDLSHRATRKELMALVNTLKDEKGAANKLRLKAVLGLIFPEGKKEGKEDATSKAKEPFDAKKAAALCKASAPAPSTQEIVSAQEPEEALRNTVNGNFDFMPGAIKRVIAEYLASLDDTGRIGFGDIYPEVGYPDLVKRIGKLEKLTSLEITDLISKLKKLHKGAFPKQTLEGGAAIVFELCKNLKEFHLQRPFIQETLRYISLHLPASAIMNLSDTDLSDEELEVFVKNCQGLYGINLTSCNITALGLQALSEHCKHLQVIDITGCKKITLKSAEKLRAVFSKAKIIGAPSPLPAGASGPLTLGNALLNAYAVLASKGDCCLNRRFQPVTDFSQRATYQQLMVLVRSFPEIEGQAQKKRLNVVLRLIYDIKPSA